jgi:hypothetical protein
MDSTFHQTEVIDELAELAASKSRHYRSSMNGEIDFSELSNNVWLC